MAELKSRMDHKQTDDDVTALRNTCNSGPNWFSALRPDEWKCLLTGITCTNNTILVADNENKKVKRFKVDGNYIDRLELDDPCGICSLPSVTDVVVTEPDEYQLTFCSLDGAMSITSVSKTKKKYECVACLDKQKLIVGCCSLGSPGVDIIDYDGNVLKSVQNDDNGKKLFRNPAAITCLNSGEILISDPGCCRLICISPEGKTEFAYDPKGRPSGIGVDSEGGIYMAQYDSHSVFRLSCDGTKESLVVGRGFEIKSPLALAVDSERLVLTEEMPSNRVLVFKLAPIPDRQATGLSLTSVRVWLHQSPRSAIQ